MSKRRHSQNLLIWQITKIVAVHIKDSRLAREFVAALPVELDKAKWQELLTEFIQNQFVADGMCADVAIHDTDGHNPHAHIMLTVRPLSRDGTWQHKTEKEYLCVKDGEERGFTASEFKTAQADGWEKQYQYKVGQKKVYMAPFAAEAQGLERASKYPKSTKYGRQNPISARWNSDEQLVAWRKAWADVNNRYLERCGQEERIDHRSHAVRGLSEQPTIHEGVTAQALERKGIISDRCEINRQIKAENALLRELKAKVKNLMKTVKNTLPALAEAMESLREKMIIFRYQVLHIQSGKGQISKNLNVLRPELERYVGLASHIKEKNKERKTLLAEKKSTSILQIPKHRELSRRIAELTEELEELKSEKALLLQFLRYPEDTGADAIRKDITAMETGLKKLEQQEQKYSAELDHALAKYAELKEQAIDFDADELLAERFAIRPAKERSAVSRVQAAYGEKYQPLTMYGSKRDISEMCGEEAETRSVREQLRQKQKPQAQLQRISKRHEQER